MDSPLVCALLERWSTLGALQKAGPDTLRSFFRKHHSRKELIDSRIKAIEKAMPAQKDRAVVEAKVQVVVQLIQVLHEGIEALNRQIWEAAEAHPVFFSSLFLRHLNISGKHQPKTTAVGMAEQPRNAHRLAALRLRPGPKRFPLR